jgi:hypothetical protein
MDARVAGVVVCCLVIRVLLHVMSPCSLVGRYQHLRRNSLHRSSLQIQMKKEPKIT